jgi:hypothetical protein
LPHLRTDISTIFKPEYHTNPNSQAFGYPIPSVKIALH